MTIRTSPSHVAPFRLALCSLALVVSACRQPDLTEAATPAAATSLALISTQSADTAFVDITLGGGNPTSLGSFTGEVVHDGAWRLLSCDAQQPQALLACKEYGSTVRVAGAWAGGTHAGALVRLAYVRASAAALPSWTFTVSEAHGARGTRLLENVEVKRVSVEGGR